MKIKLSEVLEVSVVRLKVNAGNERFFKPATGGEIDSLYKDIEERGIIVPLIAKKDGTLLAGHRRLMCAKELKLKTVPVQFVDGKLTTDEEAQFLIKDNMIRRHLTPEERKALYHVIYDNFDERVKINNSAKMGINPEELSKKTGINVGTIKNDISNMRRTKEAVRIKESPLPNLNEREVSIYQKSISRMLNTAIMGSRETKNEMKKVTEDALYRLERMP